MAKVSIENMRTRGISGSLKAFFSVNLGALRLEDLRLIQGPSGLFVGMPSKKYVDRSGATQYFDLVRFNKDSDGNLLPSSQKLRDEILNAAVEEYERRTGNQVGVESAYDENSRDEEDDLPF